MFTKFLGVLGRLGPLWFGIGFIAPFFAALAGLLGHEVILGLPAIFLGLTIGIAFGALASWRRSWL